MTDAPRKPDYLGFLHSFRGLAILCIMAQMGSFVPADHATIGLVDRVFTRVGAFDDLARGQSTFMVEMVELANILNHVTPQSLVMYAVIGAMHVVGVAMLLALYRLVRGPSVPDRILALDTLYVCAIALLMLFGMYLGTAVYFEAALIIAMLGFVGTVVLSKYVLRRDIVE